jgi:hypothetical protein
MRFLVKIKQALQQMWSKAKGSAQHAADKTCYKDMLHLANERIARMERNYLVLLKRVLEMDGVQLIVNSKAKNMNQTVMQTSAGEDNKGLNDIKPTIH